MTRLLFKTQLSLGAPWPGGSEQFGLGEEERGQRVGCLSRQARMERWTPSKHGWLSSWAVLHQRAAGFMTNAHNLNLCLAR